MPATASRDRAAPHELGCLPLPPFGGSVRARTRGGSPRIPTACAVRQTLTPTRWASPPWPLAAPCRLACGARPARRPGKSRTTPGTLCQWTWRDRRSGPRLGQSLLPNVLQAQDSEARKLCEQNSCGLNTPSMILHTTLKLSAPTNRRPACWRPYAREARSCEAIERSQHTTPLNTL